MTSLVLLKNASEGNATQKACQRLLKKIEKLRRSFETHQKLLDNCLSFYHAQLKPNRDARWQVNRDFILAMYEYYRIPSPLSKQDRALIKELLIDKIQNLFDEVEGQEIDADLRHIFEDVTGDSYDTFLSEEKQLFRQHMEQMFQDEGIDIDLSGTNMDDPHEMNRQIFEAIGEAKEREANQAPPPKQKTKKQQQREEQAKAIEEKQKSGVGTLYKQLARTFHPDLEQDPVVKVEKEQLMKQLTVAYENDDMYTLLALELQWINTSNKESKMLQDDHLKIYNAVLKDQVKSLELDIDELSMHPKYLMIHPYLRVGVQNAIGALHGHRMDIMEDIRQFQGILRDLRSPLADQVMNSILRQCAEMYADFVQKKRPKKTGRSPCKR